jgi:hypothetical protein
MYHYQMKWKSILLILVIPIVYIIFLCFQIKNKGDVAFNVFTIKNIYYQYPQVKGLSHFFELKNGIGTITDLTNIPSWLHVKPTYHINNDGLHEEIDYSIEKPPNTFRIVTVGDSFTFGLFLDTQKSWPRQLQKIINTSRCKQKIEVINLGLGRYDAQYEAERFVRKGVKYNPDLVLWLLKDNEFLYINELMNPLLTKYEKIFIPQKERNNTSSLLWKKVLESAQQDYLKQVTTSNINNIGLRSLSLINNAYTGPTIILTLPEYSKDSRVKELLDTFIKRHQNWKLKSLPNIIRLGGTFPESHPNEKGNTMIAEDVYSYLNTTNIINCK